MSDHGTPPGEERSESLADWYVDVRRRVSRSVEDSSFAAATRRATTGTDRLAAVVRGSWLYRWLTAEPDPDVVVIDLRETYTVGPFVRLLDGLLDRAGDWSESSRFVAGARSGGRLVVDSPLQVGGVLLATAAAAALIANLASGEPSTLSVLVLGGILLFGVLATRDRRSWEELRETRAVGLLAAAFEPPEPPDSPDGPNSPR